MTTREATAKARVKAKTRVPSGQVEAIAALAYLMPDPSRKYLFV
jgi:hypothetical protein